jgi:hypothetical protein
MLALFFIAPLTAWLAGHDTATECCDYTLQIMVQAVRQRDPPRDNYIKNTEFGKTAIFDAGAPGAATEWNITTVGFFCGSGKLYPGQIVGYVSGIGYERLATGEQLAATFDFGGKTTQLVLHPINDVAVARLDSGFVSDLLRARAASIQIKDYNSPNPDPIKLENVEKRLRWALSKCYKF